MKLHMISFIALLSILIVPATFAANANYDFKDPKGVNGISIKLNSKLEPMVGFAKDIDGNVTIDHENKKIISGKITVPADEVIMSNKTMTKVLHSKDWLNVKKYPEISFKYNKTISISQLSKDLYEVTVTGDFTLKGVTKEIKAPISIRFYPDKFKARNKKGEGDLAGLQVSFKINRIDFQIKPDMPTDIVADIIELNMNIIGYNKK